MNDLRKTCLTDEELAALADGTLDGSRRGAAEAHLVGCGRCRGDLLGLIDALEPALNEGGGAPPGLAPRILATLREAPARSAKAGKGAWVMRLPASRIVLAAGLLWAASVVIAVWVALELRGGPEVATSTSDGVSEDVVSRSGKGATGGDGDRAGGAPRDGAPSGPRIVVPVAEPRRTFEARLAEVAAPRRYLAHLFSDKPLYRPGERFYSRAVVLDAFDRTPPPEDREGLTARFEVRAPRGGVVAQADVPVAKGVAPFGWAVPREQEGGQYTLRASVPGYPEAELPFDVRAYRAPRLRTELEFLSKAYGPGDEVRATLAASRAEGGVPAGAKVTTVATVDSSEAYREELTLDDGGHCAVSFALPEEIRDGAGTLAMVIEDGGLQETAARTIPIVLERLDLAFYPEGGELVAGLPSSVYFEARTPRGEPGDVAGKVVDDEGAVVARFESIHEGRGKLELTPRPGRSYRAVLSKPAGLDERIALPEVLDHGFTLASLQDVTPAGEPVRVRVAAPVETGATVGLFARERELARRVVGLSAGEPLELALLPGEPASGVLRVTVFDASGAPRAERLVFREPERELEVELELDDETTVPRGEVGVTVRTRDAEGRPVPAVLGVSAVDDAVLSLELPRERAPRLPEAALLGADVRELRDAHAYLAGGPEARLRTDLLLGTQGWRRFAFAEPREFVEEHGARGRRALATAGPEAMGGSFVTLQGGHPDYLWINEVFHNRLAGRQQQAGEQRLNVGLGLDAGDAGNRRWMYYLNASNNSYAWKAANDALPRDGLLVGDIVRDARRLPGVDGRAVDFDDRLFLRGFETDLTAGGSAAGAPEWARVYAHRPPEPAGDTGDRRVDFTETVYWNAALETDDAGEARFTISASDSVTTFRIRADGFTDDGALGRTDATVEARRPFTIEPKLPLEVTAGDRIELPVACANATDVQVDAAFEVEAGEGLELSRDAPDTLRLEPGSSARATVPLEVAARPGRTRLRIRGVAGDAADDVTREVAIAPAGFPVEEHHGGLLEERAAHRIRLPEEVEPGSLATSAVAYPSPLASLDRALAALLREPTGCFEQTSSSTYPNLLTLLYLGTRERPDPAAVRRAAALLEKGYARLVSFRCAEGGYEWFGKDPGHEALTAYGVLQFTDMQEVYPVDEEMLRRTTEWLLSRRDGRGGFLRNEKALDSFGSAPRDVNDAYIVWALTGAGRGGLLEREVASLEERARRNDDPYFLGLVANVLLEREKDGAARRLLARLAERQEEDGAVGGAETSITRSGGESLEIETTALATLAWLRSPEHTANAERALRFLAGQCRGGRFGATQSTILALKAIVAHAEARPENPSGGTIELLVDGRPVAEASYADGRHEAVVLPGFAAALRGGRDHELELRHQGGGAIPYSVEVRYHSRLPRTAVDAPVALATSLSRSEVSEGEPVDLAVELRNRSGDAVAMPIALIGLPGGLEVRARQLEELVREGKIAAFETRGRDVVLYWRGFEPEKETSLVLSCIASVPGEYTGPASRAYPYYTAEKKAWAPGLEVRVRGR